jgi:hypothetical protein
MGRNVEVIVSFGGLHEKHAVQRRLQTRVRATLGTRTCRRTRKRLSIETKYRNRLDLQPALFLILMNSSSN